MISAIVQKWLPILSTWAKLLQKGRAFRLTPEAGTAISQSLIAATALIAAIIDVVGLIIPNINISSFSCSCYTLRLPKRGGGGRRKGREGDLADSKGQLCWQKAWRWQQQEKRVKAVRERGGGRSRRRGGRRGGRRRVRCSRHWGEQPRRVSWLANVVRGGRRLPPPAASPRVLWYFPRALARSLARSRLVSGRTCIFSSQV